MRKCDLIHKGIEILYGVPSMPIADLPKVCICGHAFTYADTVFFVEMPAPRHEPGVITEFMRAFDDGACTSYIPDESRTVEPIYQLAETLAGYDLRNPVLELGLEVNLMEYAEGPIETALVFDTEGRLMHWHLPPGRSSGSLPDSPELWDILWMHRIKGDGTGRIGGVAHSHPWFGSTGFSRTDVTTFAAVEEGLGQRLVWPITTFDHLHWFAWEGPGRFDYVEVEAPFELEGLHRLRLLSGLPR